MLRALCTSPAFRFRLTATYLLESIGHPESHRLHDGWLFGPHRFARQIAARFQAADGPLPMAIPFEEPGPSRATQFVAVAALVLALAGLWRQETVVSVTRVALNGLRDQTAFAAEIDVADRPAMDPSLARVVDPRPRTAPLSGPRDRQSPVQPFVYEVREGETLQDVATRFGTDVSALLWNNGLETASQVRAGARLTVLPVRGVLHLVKVGETLDLIAERYRSQVHDIVVANAIDDPNHIEAGQVIVVAGGSVPISYASEVADETVALASTPEATQQAQAAAPAATPAAPTPAAVEENLPIPPGAASWQRDFILTVAPGARESQRKTGVPASVTLAQAILESDWGRSKLTREANNLFGIKAHRSGGSAGVYHINTWEVYDGQNVTVMAAFKAYTSLADSITDHGWWFHDNNRYHGALAVKDDPRAFAYAINEAGYATDPAYAPKLIGLMDKFNLYAYDVREGQ